MTTVDRKHLAALARQAADLQQVWFREREERRAIQLADNVEFRRRWLKSDSIPDKPAPGGLRRDEDEAAPSKL
jgi:hypothetical protein